MGLLVNGQWHDQWYDTATTGGRFVRKDSQFRNWVIIGDLSAKSRSSYTATQKAQRLTANKLRKAIFAPKSIPEGLIDGVVVSEPQVQPTPRADLVIRRGARIIDGHARGLYDYITLANLYQPCAALAVSGSPFPDLFAKERGKARCKALKDNGLLASAAPDDQAMEARAILIAKGWEPESDPLHMSYYSFQIAPAVATTFANAYGRFRVTDNLCNLSIGGLSEVDPEKVAQIFGLGSGIPPTPPGGGIDLINNASVGGRALDPASRSPSTQAEDYNFDGALCLRGLFEQNTPDGKRVRAGMAEVRRSGRLRGKPAIIVHGRSDNLILVNHTSRPYYGLNQLVEGPASKLRYYEVTNAQHFEAFLSLPGYDPRFVPLHVYAIQALDMMHAHLKDGTPLPPSQVVRTNPRGGEPGAAPALTRDHVPPISPVPANADPSPLAAKR